MGGAANIGQVIVETVRRVREAKPQAIYCCDPVMGDVGRGFFVTEGIRDFMRAEAVPAADIITPNQFELQFLTGQEVHSLEDALAAAKAVRAMGPKLVLLTSLTRDEAPADRSRCCWTRPMARSWWRPRACRSTRRPMGPATAWQRCSWRSIWKQATRRRRWAMRAAAIYAAFLRDAQGRHSGASAHRRPG